jgi:hypothetical protein
VLAHRTSAWADIARRIAHEIKNPLTPIQLSAERLRRKYGKVIVEDAAVFEQCTATIVRQVDDIKRMVDEFSRFARMPKAVIAGEDVAETVRQVVFMMRVAHPDIDIEVELPEETMPARFDRRLISQALTNIVKNATEAIGAVPPAGLGRGRIVVSTLRDGKDVVVDVIDNGIGLPKENRSRLLEPYVTTREKGTARSDRRPHLEEHGGHISCATLRKDPRRARRVEAIALCGRDDRGVRSTSNLSKRRPIMPTDILIVDDEADIRELVAGILQDEGYGTRTAVDADEGARRGGCAPAQSRFPRHLAAGQPPDGLQLLDAQAGPSELPVVMIRSHGNIETGVAIKRGAYVSSKAIQGGPAAGRCRAHAGELAAQARGARARLGPLASTLVDGRGDEPLRQVVEKVGPTNSRVLIVGPSGSGKEARCPHHSRRADGPFVG